MYDLRQDPGEQHNLPFASAEDEKRVSGILEAHLAASERLRARFNVAAEGEKMDRTDVDLLRSLGYL